MKIMPAPLEETADGLRDQLTKLTPYFKSFQIDIGDGIFVPNKTVELTEACRVLADFPGITVDFHLMVQDWEKDLEVIESLKGPSVRYVLIHSKTNPSPEVFSKKMSKQFQLGLVINPDEDVEAIGMKYDMKSLKVAQIMTVLPGKQGQPFIEESLNKIDQIRNKNYEICILLDGAVNDKTLPLILNRKNRPDEAGIGSYLTKSKDLKAAIATLDAMEGVTRA